MAGEPRTKCTDEEKQSARNLRQAMGDWLRKMPSGWDIFMSVQAESDAFGWGWTDKQRTRVREMYTKFVTRQPYEHVAPSQPVNDIEAPF